LNKSQKPKGVNDSYRRDPDALFAETPPLANAEIMEIDQSPISSPQHYSSDDEEEGSLNKTSTDTTMLPTQEEEEEEEEEEEGFTFDISETSQLDKIVEDKNYYVLEYSKIYEACEYLSQESNGKISSDTFYQELNQLRKRMITYKDRNHPKKKENGQLCLNKHGKKIYDKRLRGKAVMWEEIPKDESNNAGHPHGSFNNQSNGIQLCILIEFLEQERNDSLNDIIRKGLSYAGARQREIISACGPSALMVTKDPMAASGKGNSDDDDDSDSDSDYESDGKAKGVLREYLGTIPVAPNPKHKLYRVNHFPQDDVTDSLVFNNSLNSTGTWARGWGDSRRDPSRRHQLPLVGDLNELMITEYWHRCGLPIQKELLPWNETKLMHEMVFAGKDKTGTPMSCNVKGHYPNSYLPTTRQEKSEIKQQVRKRTLDRGLDDYGDTTTTTTNIIMSEYDDPFCKSRKDLSTQEYKDMLEVDREVMKNKKHPTGDRYTCHDMKEIESRGYDEYRQDGDAEEEKEEEAEEEDIQQGGDFAVWLRQQRKRKRSAFC
jgi:hypothetical protein